MQQLHPDKIVYISRHKVLFRKWVTFFFMIVFSTALIKFLPVTVFEPRTSGMGNGHYVNWATTINKELFLCAEERRHYLYHPSTHILGQLVR